MSEQGRSAREAATESLISNLVSILVLVGVSLAMTRRDWIMRRAMAARASWQQNHARSRANREIADFARRVSDYDHGGA